MKNSIQGKIEDSKLSLSWTEITDFSSFNIKIGRLTFETNEFDNFFTDLIHLRSLRCQGELLPDQRREAGGGQLHAGGRGIQQVHHLQHPPRGL